MVDFRFKAGTNTRTVIAAGDAFPMDKGSPDVVRRYSQIEDFKTALEVGGSAALVIEGSQLVTPVNQTGHGLSIGPIHHNGTAWVAADASGVGLACHAFMVQLIDANNFTYAVIGEHTVTGQSYGTGLNYLSTTAGAIGTTPPGLGNIRQRVAVATGPNDVILTIGHPEIQ